MIGKVRVYKDLSLWHRWFAWRPVQVHAGKMSAWVWWQYIERKVVYGYDDHRMTYRLLRKQP